MKGLRSGKNGQTGSSRERAERRVILTRHHRQSLGTTHLERTCGPSERERIVGDRPPGRCHKPFLKYDPRRLRLVWWRVRPCCGRGAWIAPPAASAASEPGRAWEPQSWARLKRQRAPSVVIFYGAVAADALLRALPESGSSHEVIRNAGVALPRRRRRRCCGAAGGPSTQAHKRPRRQRQRQSARLCAVPDGLRVPPLLPGLLRRRERHTPAALPRPTSAAQPHQRTAVQLAASGRGPLGSWGCSWVVRFVQLTPHLANGPEGQGCRPAASPRRQMPEGISSDRCAFRFSIFPRVRPCALLSSAQGPRLPCLRLHLLSVDRASSSQK